MTIAELSAQIESVDDLRLVVAWRVLTGHVLPGARVDLTCAICDERIALNPVSCKMIEGGAVRLCRECYQAATGIENLEPGDRGGL